MAFTDRKKPDPIAQRFLDRCWSAHTGEYLPTTFELLLGMPFKLGDLGEDIDEFVEDALRACRRAKLPASLSAALRSAKSAPSVDTCSLAALACREQAQGAASECEEWALRMDLYACAFGSPSSTLQIAMELASLAIDPESQSPSVAPVFLARLLGLLESQEDFCNNPEDRMRLATLYGIDALQALNPTLIKSAASGSSILTVEPGTNPFRPDGGRAKKLDTSAAAAEEPQPSAIVFTSIGNDHNSEGLKIRDSWKPLIGATLRLPIVPDLNLARSNLIQEFPYAAALIDTLLGSLSAKTHLQIRPTIFVGGPGLGKSRFTERLLHHLGIPSMTFPCGGVADSSFAGTSRQWNSGRPALPVSFLRQTECAGPAIVLDEIEKAGFSQHNGSVWDALLGLLETETARRWFDPYLEAPVDLSYISWLATANSIESLPSPLRDRFRILSFPEPTLRDLGPISLALVRQLTEDRGLDERWGMPLSQEELDCVSSYWQGGSIRKLTKLVEAVLEVRERFTARH